MYMKNKTPRYHKIIKYGVFNGKNIDNVVPNNVSYCITIRERAFNEKSEWYSTNFNTYLRSNDFLKLIQLHEHKQYNHEKVKNITKKKLALEIELIPKWCIQSNIRNVCDRELWYEIASKEKEKAKHRCCICGESGIRQGFKHKAECHEVFSYDIKKKIQKLVAFMVLCPLCHQSKHLFNQETEQIILIKRIKTINKMSDSQFKIYYKRKLSILKKLEDIRDEWSLDISIVKKYGFKVYLYIMDKNQICEEKWRNPVYRKKMRHAESQIRNELNKRFRIE